MQFENHRPPRERKIMSDHPKKVYLAIENIEHVTDFNKLGTYDDWQTVKCAALAQQSTNTDITASPKPTASGMVACVYWVCGDTCIGKITNEQRCSNAPCLISISRSADTGISLGSVGNI